MSTLFKKIFLYFNLFLFISTLFFNRAFYGISILGFRLGEILIAFCLLFSLLFLITRTRFDGLFFFRTKQITVLILTILSFTTLRIIFYVFQSEIIDIEFFRFSSFVWTLILLFNFNNFPKLENIKPGYLIVTLSALFVLQFLGYPDLILNFFNNYSDKVIFFKPADLFLGVISIYILLHFRSKNVYKILFIPIYLPLFLFLSRGSFLGFLLFGSIFIFDFFKSSSLSDIFKISTLSILLFIFSSNLIVTYAPDNNNNLNYVYADENIELNFLNSLIKNKNTQSIFSFFYDSGRLYSFDNNINWRIQIWQDEIENTKDNFLIGNGFFKVMKSMELDFRKGFDGNNIYPHNFFITIFSNGGILLLSLFLLLYFFIFTNSKNIYVKSFLVSGLLVSCFDVTMEGVQFPYIFYSTLGYIYHFTDS